MHWPQQRFSPLGTSSKSRLYLRPFHIERVDLKCADITSDQRRVIRSEPQPRAYGSVRQATQLIKFRHSFNFVIAQAEAGNPVKLIRCRIKLEVQVLAVV